MDRGNATNGENEMSLTGVVSSKVTPDPSDNVQQPRYIVTATLYSPKGRLIGRLEHTWLGPETIGQICSILISNSQDRSDMDHCHIELRWRKGRPSIEPSV
jgi:hypothetical protein